MNKNEQMEKLLRKAYHPSTLTDRELAQVRRSCRVGARLLAKVVAEQKARGLLRAPRFECGDCWPEATKRISDYPVERKSPKKKTEA